MLILDSSVKVANSGASSRGNQTKFYTSCCWVKLDSARCCEGLAEVFTSKFEGTLEGFPYVHYYPIEVSYLGEPYKACYSQSMYYDPGMQFISLRNLFRSNGIPLNIFTRSEDVCENMMNVISEVRRFTGLDISQYLFRTLMLDALIINEDRHQMNLGVCLKAGRFYEAPVFDNGSSLFCVNWTYRKKANFEDNIRSARSVARPFSKFFDRQVEACIKLGANPLRVNEKSFRQFIDTFFVGMYSNEENERAKRVLLNRLDYYKGKGVYTFV